MTDRIPLDHLTSDQYDQLCDELEALRQVARGYCPACGRGDAAPTIDDWQRERQRAEQAEADVKRLRNDIAGCRNQQWPQRLGRTEKRLARVTALAERWVRSGPPPLGTPLARWWDKRLAELLAALDEPAPAATQATSHVYLSTGCFHGDHAYCKNMTGLNGAKRPGECKHCGTKCICECHTEETP
ncbi:hypothetical protein PV377_47355 [Streptomyces ipomoeae]|uniref:hypothetical protein n=1 Tax=Streptomyces ipomoeae TaxID=103232 RepID=UPI0029AF6988|nr:hypothetical protein [Streptomyces ipomoeae]MDX2846438.1 hypothetical protein [Streptomyces ipomoeae]